MELSRSFLIQRLEKPNLRPDGDGICHNPFTFGGGRMDGGFHPEIAEKFAKLFRFEYMGSTEFEWGALPLAIWAMAWHAGATTKRPEEIPGNHWGIDVYRLPQKPQGLKATAVYIGHQTVFLLAPDGTENEFAERLRAFAKDEYDRKYSTKAHVGLRETLERLSANEEPKHLGWIELNNGAFFTVDRGMFCGMMEFFGLETEKEFFESGTKE
jgi:hypothetical protein